MTRPGRAPAEEASLQHLDLVWAGLVRASWAAHEHVTGENAFVDVAVGAGLRRRVLLPKDLDLIAWFGRLDGDDEHVRGVHGNLQGRPGGAVPADVLIDAGRQVR